MVFSFCQTCKSIRYKLFNPWCFLMQIASNPCQLASVWILNGLLKFEKLIIGEDDNFSFSNLIFFVINLPIPFFLFTFLVFLFLWHWRHQICETIGNAAKISKAFRVIPCESNTSSKFIWCWWCKPISEFLYFLWVGLNTFSVRPTYLLLFFRNWQVLRVTWRHDVLILSNTNCTLSKCSLNIWEKRWCHQLKYNVSEGGYSVKCIA